LDLILESENLNFGMMKAEEPIVSYGMLDETKEYTYTEYLTWKFQERVELIRGKIRKMSPAPSWKHQGISQSVNTAFKGYLKDHACKVFYAPLDVVLPISSKKKNTTVVQPDVCILCDTSKLDDHGIVGAPDLIVEILSPGNTKHDLDTKFQLYEEAKVPEYWIVNPMERYVLIYTLVNDEYAGSKHFMEGDVARSKHFKGLEVEVNKVFEGV
jgi:Uma2 family endonuclease